MSQNISKIFSRILNVLVICGCLYGVYLGYHLWLERSRTFEVKNIRISGNDYFSENEILEMGNIPASGSIWQIPLDDATQKVEAHPFINRVHITRKLPDILQITVEEKKPVAMLNFENELYFLDPAGMVLPNVPGKAYDLPLISGDFMGGVMTGCEIDNPWIDEGLGFVRQIRKTHPEIYRNVSEIVVGKSDGLQLFLRQNALPVYLGESDRNHKLKALEAVLEDLEKKGELHLVSYINLKFTNQVVVGMGA